LNAANADANTDSIGELVIEGDQDFSLAGDITAIAGSAGLLVTQ